MVEHARCLIVKIKSGIHKIRNDLRVLLFQFFDLDFFLCHAYKIPQPRKNTRNFLQLKKYFFCA